MESIPEPLLGVVANVFPPVAYVVASALITVWAIPFVSGLSGKPWRSTFSWALRKP